jgi:uncharacterized protein (DUF1499 family)
MKRSKIALVAAFLGAVALFDVVLGPVLIHLGVVSPLFGFQWLFGLGLLEGIFALILGLVGLYTTRAASGVGGRPLALFGVASGAVLVGVLMMSAGPSSDLPPINDITTNLGDPPAFTSDPAERGRDMAYPAEFVAQVQEAYPELQTIVLEVEPATALERAEAAARELGWEIVAVDAAAGTILARDATAVFQFVDDVVVRGRAAGGKSEIDLRSKSRDGRGVPGANAARIRAFSEKIGT